jgi:hypothetical protein
VLEKIASGVGTKLEGGADEQVDKMEQDLKTVKEKLEKDWL